MNRRTGIILLSTLMLSLLFEGTLSKLAYLISLNALLFVVYNMLSRLS